jgi:hypothetical protein
MTNSGVRLAVVGLIDANLARYVYAQTYKPHKLANCMIHHEIQSGWQKATGWTAYRI